jgi:hypothetical protein
MAGVAELPVAAAAVIARVLRRTVKACFAARRNYAPPTATVRRRKGILEAQASNGIYVVSKREQPRHCCARTYYGSPTRPEPASRPADAERHAQRAQRRASAGCQTRRPAQASAQRCSTGNGDARSVALRAIVGSPRCSAARQTHCA